ncbi:MAG: glycosyltransferase family 2 protein [Treponema sp.]|nr:glycosyltransferase family 2 protein [Treponema sp.]
MKFSIIVPMYNSADTIKSCVESIKNQTYLNFECLLIDDGSSDNTVILCQNMIKDDPRIQLIQQENKGVSAARNTGLKNASGDYLVFVDSDDSIEKNLLEEINKVANGEIIQYDFLSITGEKAQSWAKSKGAFDIKAGNMAVVWRHAIPFEPVRELRFDESLSCGEDYLFLNEALKKIGSVLILRKCLYRHRFNCKNSIMNNINLRLLDQQVCATEKVKALFEDQMTKEDRKAIKIREDWCKGETLLYGLNLFDKNTSKFRNIWIRIIKKLAMIFS